MKETPQSSTGAAQKKEARPVALFQGYDSLTGGGRATTAQGTARRVNATARLDYHVCTNLQQLKSALDISSSISGRTAFGTVDAKAQYLESLSLTEYSVVIVVYANIISGSETASDYGWRQGFKAPDDNPAAVKNFFLQYGDSFVNQITTGAEYAATYVFYSTTVQEQSTVLGTLDVNGIAAHGSVSASVEKAYEAVTTRKVVAQFMDGFTNPVFPDERDIISFAGSFGKKTPTAPEVLSWNTLPYTKLGEMPDTFNRVLDTLDIFDDLALKQAALEEVRSTVHEITGVYQHYLYTGDGMLVENGKTIEGDLQTLDTLFKDMERDPTKQYAKPALPGLTLGTPVLTCPVTRIDLGGVSGGNPFDDVPADAVEHARHVKQVKIGTGWCNVTCDSRIETTYQWFEPLYNAAGTNMDETTVTTMVPHGGARENVTEWGPALSLQDGERITGVSVTVSGFVAQVDLSTSSSSHALTWMRSASGTTKSWSETGTRRLLGFFGRSGVVLNALGVVYGTFAPAEWVQRSPLGTLAAAEARAAAPARAGELVEV